MEKVLKCTKVNFAFQKVDIKVLAKKLYLPSKFLTIILELPRFLPISFT